MKKSAKKSINTGAVEAKINPPDGLGSVDTGCKRVRNDDEVDDYLYCKVVIRFERWLGEYECKSDETQLFKLKAMQILEKLVDAGPLSADHPIGNDVGFSRYR